MKYSKSFVSVSYLIIFMCLFFSYLPQAQAVNLDPNNPNILFIMTDQQRFDAMSRRQDEMSAYNGKTKIRTPNMDRLSFTSAYFENAYAQCAVCGPSRTSLRSGCAMERTGVQTNGLADDDNVVEMSIFEDRINNIESFDQILVEDYGYISEYYGKWHMPDRLYYERSAVTPVQGGVPQVIEYNDYDYASQTFTFAHNEQWAEKCKRYLSYFNGLGEISKTLSGVEQEDTFTKYPYTPVQLDARYGEPSGTDIASVWSGKRTSQPNVTGYFPSASGRFSERYTPMYLNGEIAVKALDRLAQQNNPFLLTASFHNPHAPMIPANEYLDYYWNNRDNLFVSPSISDNGNNSAYFPESSLITWGYSDPVKVKEWTACYYAMIEQIDSFVGQMLDKLDEYGITGNTLVIFLSDHGEMLGAHASREKNKFMEESAHVPLMFSFPGQIAANTVIDTPVSLIDVFSTILDYTGKSASDNSDGKSLRRFIEQTSYNKDYDETAVITEWDYRENDDNNPGTLTRSLGGETNLHARKGPYKLMMTKLASSSRLDMMYNLDTDPYEVDNLVGDDGMSASDEVIGKAEHLKCLMIEWMQRMDGADHFYSDPVWNNGEGNGDITEITNRRKWKLLPIWVCDTDIEVGLPADVSGQLKRNEYIYFGHTTSGTLNVSKVRVQGADAARFQLDGVSAVTGIVPGNISQGNYKRVKLTYLPDYYGQPITDAQVVIENSAGSDKIINLSAVPPENLAPEINSTPTTSADVDVQYSYTLTATDFEGDPLTYTAVSIPAWLNFNTNSAVLSGTPGLGDVGIDYVSLRVSDPYRSIDQNFSLYISSSGNDAPVITSTPETGVIEDNEYRYTISAIDLDGDDLTYGQTSIPSWASFDSGTGVLSGTPVPADQGTYYVKLTVSDGSVVSEQEFNIHVFETPTPNLVQNPSFKSGSANWTPGGSGSLSTTVGRDDTQSWQVATYASGSSRQTVPIEVGKTYKLSVWVNSLSMTTGNFVFDTQDKYDDTCQWAKGTVHDWTQYSGTFTATNTSVNLRMFCTSTHVGETYFDDIELVEVGGGNIAPVITSVPITNGTQGTEYEYTLLAADAEDDTLTFSEVSIPGWASFDPGSGILSGTPTSGGDFAVSLQVSDGDLTDQQNFTVSVEASAGYAAWAEEQTETIGDASIDYDGDGKINLYEYALGGDPVDAGDDGVEPAFTKVGDAFEYAHKQRSDDPNLIYEVQVCTDLTSGVWTPAGATAGTNVTGGAYDDVTHTIETVNPQSYIRLEITNP